MLLLKNIGSNITFATKRPYWTTVGLQIRFDGSIWDVEPVPKSDRRMVSKLFV